MTVEEKIYAYLREMRAADPRSTISDFQMRVRNDAVIIVNLKTNESKVIPVEEKDNDWI